MIAADTLGTYVVSHTQPIFDHEIHNDTTYESQ